jgi:hypothetical protein
MIGNIEGAVVARARSFRCWVVVMEVVVAVGASRPSIPLSTVRCKDVEGSVQHPVLALRRVEIDQNVALGDQPERRGA